MKRIGRVGIVNELKRNSDGFDHSTNLTKDAYTSFETDSIRILLRFKFSSP